MRARGIATLASALAALALLAAPSAALADGPHLVLAPALLGIVGHALGSVFHAIAGVVLGGFNWTVGVAGKFILNTLGGLIRLLIPASWAAQGLAVMHWVVAVPDYAGTITVPGGHAVYGFAGVNALRDLFTWIGAALLPLTLVYATSRAMLGAGGGQVAAPLARVLGLAAVLVSYPWWWAQGAALVNQLTHFILALPPVEHGVYRLMQYAVGGVALGGWQLIDLALMGAIGVALLGLIFLKVVVILLGALLYAVGPLMIALVPSGGGLVLARAWLSATLALIALPVAWTSIVAIGAVLINDAGTAGPLIAGQGAIASLLGGLLLAMAGLASLWLCLRAAREACSIVRGQLAGVIALGSSRGGVASASARPSGVWRASESLRSFAGRVGGASGAALEAAGPGGRLVAAGSRGLAARTRTGLIGAAGAGIRVGAAAVAPGTAALMSRTRAGAVAVRMARAGTASWRQSAPGRAAGRGSGAGASVRFAGPARATSGSPGGDRPWDPGATKMARPGSRPGAAGTTTAAPPGAGRPSSKGRSSSGATAKDGVRRKPRGRGGRGR